MTYGEKYNQLSPIRKKAKEREYRTKNRDVIKQKRDANKARNSAYQMAYREKNKEKAKEYQRKYKQL